MLSNFCSSIGSLRDRQKRTWRGAMGSPCWMELEVAGWPWWLEWPCRVTPSPLAAQGWFFCGARPPLACPRSALLDFIPFITPPQVCHSLAVRVGQLFLAPSSSPPPGSLTALLLGAEPPKPLTDGTGAAPCAPPVASGASPAVSGPRHYAGGPRALPAPPVN